jgi:hypothetical protein
LIIHPLYDATNVTIPCAGFLEGGGMIDLEKAARFPTADSEWKRKVLIGGLLNIVPIINFLAIGYAYMVFRKAFERGPMDLPEWEDWGKLFLRGVVLFVIALIYNIVSLILFLIHPVIGLLAAIAVALLFPAAMAQYAVRENFADAFQLKVIWDRIQQNKSDYFLAWLIMIGVFIVLMIIGMIPVLGWIISSIIGFYVYLSFAFIFGDICSRSGILRQPSSEHPDAENKE